MAMRYPGGLIATSPVNAAYPSGVWTQSQTIPYASQNVWQNDQYWRNTTLLLHGDGTNGAQNNTFLDSSTNNFTITRNGNTTQGSFSPYGANWSNYFDGSGDYFTAPYTTANFDWWTSGSDFTIEAWVFATSLSTWQYTDSAAGVNSVMVGNASATSEVNYWSFGPLSDGTVRFKYYNGANNFVTSTAKITTNTWNHVAMTKTSSGVTVFVNGLAGTTTAISGTPQSSTSYPLIVGQINNACASGYISNLRVVRGTAIYSGNFTPPTTPLTAVTNTKLLTCQSNRFVDNSSNALTLTVTGNTSVQAFSPFAPSAAYSTATIGGSGYFDGSGDYLTVTSSTAFDMTGDFTVEMWVYPITLNATNGATVFSCGATSLFQLNTLGAGTKIEWYSTTNPSIISVSYSGYLQLNQWNHLVACRTGTTLAIFVNGTRLGTATDNTSYDLSQLYLSYQPGSSHFLNGYMGDVRVIKGSGPYNATQSTLTVPTAPLTAITNTQLLLSCTNAGIYDNSMMNNLETVGNAQISTSVVKYGTGSLAFNGSTDYLTSPQSVNIDLPGDFTVECWIYFGSVSGTSAIVGKWGGSGAYAWVLQYISGTGLRFYTGVSGGLGTSIAGAWTPSTGVWYHIAVSRSSGSVRLFVNGSQVGTTTTNTDNCTTSNQALNIGRNADTNIQYLNGYIDDLRITKGVARYISNFTPPIARMPNQ